MPLFSFEGRAPEVHPDAFVAPTATLVGDVTVEEGASVWFGAVIRADFASVVVRAGANVQDGSVVHGPPGTPTEIGPGATVAHLCVVHGAVLGEECLVASGAVIPDGVLAAGSPAVVKRPLEGTPSEFWVQANPQAYRELAARHREGVQPV